MVDIDDIIKSISKDFGSVISSGHEVLANAPARVPFSPCVDAILSGGIEEGSWLDMRGPSKTGKSTSALSFAANAQKEEHGGRVVVYGAVEGRISRTHMKGIKGLNLSPEKFRLVHSTEERILSSQDFLRIFETLLKSIPQLVLIIDSVSVLCEQREMDGGVGTETRGGGAKLFSQFCRNMAGVVPVMKSIVIGVTHLISNTSGFGKKYVPRQALAFGYQGDYQMEIRKSVPILGASGKEVGKEIHWRCLTSKNGPPGMNIESYLRYGVGIDKVYEALHLGVAAGVIKKSGSWYAFSFLEKYPSLGSPGDIKAQGLEGAYKLLVDNPEWATALIKEIEPIAHMLTRGNKEEAD